MTHSFPTRRASDLSTTKPCRNGIPSRTLPPAPIANLTYHERSGGDLAAKVWWTADNRADLHRDWHIVAPMQLDSTPSPLPTLPLRFGTPLTENSIRVMMLGSGELGDRKSTRLNSSH